MSITRRIRTFALIAVLAMLATWGVLVYRGLIAPVLHGVPHPEEPLVLGVMPVAWVLLAASVALVVVSLATQPPADATLRKYFD